METKKSYAGPVLIIIAALLWAVDGVIRRNLYILPPITIIFLEHLIGLIILSPFVFKYVLKTQSRHLFNNGVRFFNIFVGRI